MSGNAWLFWRPKSINRCNSSAGFILWGIAMDGLAEAREKRVKNHNMP